MENQKKLGAAAFLPLIVFLALYVGCGITFTLTGVEDPFGQFPRHVALLAGVAAKEAVVSTMGTAYSLGDVDPEDAQSLGQLLQSNPNWNKATALSLMLFVLLYSPCFVSLVVIQREAGGWRWLIFSMVFNTLLAFAVSVAAYQIGLVVWD